MSIKTYHFDAVVVGTGAAGYNGACRIMQENLKSVAIVTEDTYAGTSRNTGSDKQTYYKLGLGGDSPDSVRKMASDLFAGRWRAIFLRAAAWTETTRCVKLRCRCGAS